jgi:RHS repeat-associated protein
MCTYVYAGDGNLVKRDGNYYEYTNGSAKKFYYAGGVRIAVRPADGVARWILSVHPSLSLRAGLGSTAKTVSAGGATEGEQRYMPFGLDRYTTGSLNTAYRFTGQRIEDNTDLYFYQSRWYDPVVGRFLQADSIVPEPGNPQGLNRYSYTINNPMRYIDPTGHAYDAGGVNSYTQEEVLRVLAELYDIAAAGDWQLQDLRNVQQGIEYMRARISRTTGDPQNAQATLRAMLGGSRIVSGTPFGRSCAWANSPTIGIKPTIHLKTTGDRNQGVEETVVHEFGHILDYKMGRANSGDWSLGASYLMASIIRDGQNGSPTDYGESSALEDFAESWDVFVFGDGARRLAWRQRGRILTPNRQQFMEALIVSANAGVALRDSGWSGTFWSAIP